MKINLLSSKKCLEPGCDREMLAKGYCRRHYQQRRRRTPKEKQKKRQRRKELYHTNPIYRSKIQERDADYYQRNKERILKQRAERYQKNKEAIAAEASKPENLARRAERKRNRMKTDIQFKLECRLRERLHGAVKNEFKGGSAVKNLGCSIAELKIHLEKQFQLGMSWENWKPDGWHIDHIKPLARFDLTDQEQLKQACHYTNLQPLWSTDNTKKGAR